MSNREFDELSIEKQRNEILKAIHNRLSEINTSLEYWIRSVIHEGDLKGMNEFQREFTKFIQPCDGMYYHEDNEPQEQEGETS